MQNGALKRAGGKAVILATACIGLALWSTSCGGGSNVVQVSTAGFSLSATTITFASQAVGTTSAAQSATLVNVGNATLTLTSIQVTGPNAGDYTLTNGCGASLAPQAQCTLSMTFTPSAAGTRTASLVFTDNAADSPQTVSLTGTGTSAGVGLSSTVLTFGSQLIGTSTAAQTVTLTNNGSAALNITSVAVTGANAADFAETSTCGSSVAAGGACTISVTFTPAAAGSRTGTVTITDSAAGSPQTISLSGTGSGSGVTLSATSLAFNNQNLGTTSAAQSVTLTNAGNAVLNIVNISLTGANPGDFSLTTTCGSSVAVGDNCTISTAFTPGAAGNRSAAVSITDNAGSGSQMITLTGPGAGTGAIADLSSTSLTFGSQTLSVRSLPMVVTLTNTGNVTLTYTPPIPVSGVNAGDFSESDNCGGSVTAGTTCTISVTFTPSATGNRTASVTLTSNATPNPQVVSLSGTGVTSAVSLSANTLTFTSQPVHTTSTAQSVILTNNGSSSLSVSSLALTGTNAGDFAQTNNCGSTVAAGVSCTINVTFTPSVAGTETAAVTITDNATGSPQTVALTGMGGAPVASLTATTLIFTSQTLGTTSGVQIVTLTNTGNTALAITSLAVTGTNAGDFAQTNGCGSSVAVSANCTISVTFSPTAPGNRTASVTITDNAAGSPQTVSLSGTGNGPVVSLSAASLTFASTSLGSTSASQIVTLNNTGNAALSLSGIAFTGANPGDFADTTTCGSSIAASGSCTISVTFTPAAEGSRAAVLNITDNATNSPQTVNVTGTGSAPIAGGTPTSLTFTGQNSGTTSGAQTITLNNTGNAALSITGIAFTGANPGDFAETNTCGSSVAANGSCTISVKFTPAVAGSRTATLTVTDNTNYVAGSTQSVSLTGTGSGPGISFSPPSLTFGSQTQGTTSPAQTVTLTDTGTTSLTGVSIALTGANSADFAETTTCGSTVTPNQSCTITVTFTPLGNSSRAATITVTDNASGSPQSVALTGSGLSGQITLSPADLTFTSQSVGVSSAPQTVTITNTGSASFTMNGISLTGSNPGDFSQTNTCGTSLAQNATCAVVVKFTPTALGTRTASVTITDSLSSSPQTAALTGTASGSMVSLSPGSLTFANQNVGATSAAQTVTLSNTGNVSLTITSIAATGTNSGDYTVTNTCGSSVAANGSCTITVTFTPGAIGSRTAAVTLTDSAGGSPQTVSLTGTGASPAVSLSATSLVFASQTVGTTSAVQTLTLSNTGNVALSISGITFTGVNPGDFGETTTCGSSVAAGGNCTLSVTVTPTGIGSRTATLNITDNNNNVAHSSQIVNLTGTGSGPTATLNPPLPLPFGSQSVGSTSAAQIITLTNAGNTSLTLTNISITGSNASDFVVTTTCPLSPSSVAVNGNCMISLTFKPTLASTENATLTVTDNAPGSPQAVTLTGTGTSSVVSLSASTLNFNNEALFSPSVPMVVTLNNTGNGALTITNIQIVGSNAADYGETNTCGSSVAASGSCVITVTLTPSAIGSRTASLSISDNAAAGSPQAVSLIGFGVLGSVGLSATSLSFGNQAVGTTSTTQSVTVTNTGNTSLTITSITVTGTNASDYAQTNTCGSPIAVGASCTLSATFAPLAPGSRTGSLTISYNAVGSPQTVSLSGTGTQLVITISPTSAALGNVVLNATGTLPMVLTNTGTGSVTISQATVTGAGFGKNSLSLPLSLPVGQNTSFNVTFTPTATGSASGDVTIVSNAANSPTIASLSGTGVLPPACSGVPITQTQTDVTSTLGILPGVVVTQLTSVATPLQSWNTYADVPLFSIATNPNVLVMNYGTNPNGIVIANPDGTNPQKINGSLQGTWAVVSNDGQYVAYQGQNMDNTSDLFAIKLTAPGTCAPVNLTNLHLSLTPPASALIYSTTQIDPSTGLNVFAVSEGVPLHTVESDGTHLRTVNFSDPYGLNGQIFHRLRLNPVFPNKVWYKRDAPVPNPQGTATPEIWVADITNPSVVYNSAIVNGVGVPADHNAWSLDGTTIGFDYNGLWYTIQVLNSDGTWVNGGNFGSATLVGPPSSAALAVDYCSLAPDSSEYVCTRGPNAGQNFTGEIFLMSVDGQRATPLAYAGSTSTLDNGIPKAHFGDKQHIYFSSDLSGSPEVYVITGFPAIPH